MIKWCCGEAVKRVLCGVFVSSVGLLSSCVDAPTQPSAPRAGDGLSPGARHQLYAAAQGRSSRGFEDEILRLEARIPGFGGMFRDNGGRIIVYLQDLGHASVAMAELRASAQHLKVDRAFQSDLAAGANVVFRRGQFTFSQLLDWKPLVGAAVARIPGFQSIDANESTNRIQVNVKQGTGHDLFRRAVALLPVPEAAIELVSTPEMMFLASIRGRFRPTEGGMQVSNRYAARCTLGFNVTTYAWNESGFLTASHCSAYGAGTTGDSIYQATVSGNNFVGTVYLNPPWNLTDPDCLGYTQCSLGDVMFVQYPTPSTGAKGPRINNLYK